MNSLRSIRSHPSMAHRFRHAPLVAAFPGTEREAEEYQHPECRYCGHNPDRVPLVRHLEALVRSGPRIAAGGIGHRVTIHHRARNKRTDEVSQAIGHEVDEALCGCANLLP